MPTKNIVLVHGLWVTPRSWEYWIPYYTEKGYNVTAPAYPGLEVEVEALNADPSPIAKLTIPGLVDHFSKVIEGLDSKPIIIGHSMGGFLTQKLLDRGYGVAGVAIDSVAPEGVVVPSLEQAKATAPIFNPLNLHKAVGFTEDQFHYAFANTLSKEDSAKAYQRYHVPAPADFLWEGILANILPGHQSPYVNFANDDRAPLLLIAGGEDHLMPPAVNEANFKKYSASKAVTDFKLFVGRSHFTCGEPGWEAVADYALEWAEGHAKA